MILSLCKNSRGIGFRNQLPWVPSILPKNTKYFNDLTIGRGNNAVILGRNTWNNHPYLTNRTPLILSANYRNTFITHRPQQSQQPHIFNNVSSLNAHLKQEYYQDIWIIGGESIYKQWIQNPQLKNIFITEVNMDLLYDKTAPHIPSNFILTFKSNWEKDGNIPYRRLKYSNLG